VAPGTSPCLPSELLTLPQRIDKRQAIETLAQTATSPSRSLPRTLVFSLQTLWPDPASMRTPTSTACEHRVCCAIDLIAANLATLLRWLLCATSHFRSC
jgi:hypothetical protein